MNYTFALMCLVALVVPSLQYDDLSLSLKESRLARSGRGNRRISAGLDVVGPLGGRLSGRVNGGRSRNVGLLGRSGRGGLSGSLRGNLPGGLSRGVSGQIGGGWDAGINGFGGDISGRLNRHIGNGYVDLHRSGIQGRIRGGVHVDVPVVAAGYVAGGPVGFGNQCGFLPPACRGSPAERNVVCKYTYDSRLNRCIEVNVFLSCAARGQSINLFHSMRECNMYCR